MPGLIIKNAQKMKKFIILMTMMGALPLTAQVAIGKEQLRSASVSLEFADANRGLLLPWVASAAATTGAANGTFIFDSSDKKVKYRKNGSWFDLSLDPRGKVNTSLQDQQSDNPAARVAIGKNPAADKTPGVLVLTDSDRAMVLPRVASPHLNIVQPEPGLMVFDTVTRQLAVFNGTVWTFWKP